MYEEHHFAIIVVFSRAIMAQVILIKAPQWTGFASTRPRDRIWSLTVVVAAFNRPRRSTTSGLTAVLEDQPQHRPQDPRNWNPTYCCVESHALDPEVGRSRLPRWQSQTLRRRFLGPETRILFFSVWSRSERRVPRSGDLCKWSSVPRRLHWLSSVAVSFSAVNHFCSTAFLWLLRWITHWIDEAIFGHAEHLVSTAAHVRVVFAFES